MSGIVVTTQCKHCSKFKPHYEIWLMPGGATICPDCQRFHDKALDALTTLLSGEVAGCVLCGKDWRELNKLAGGGDYPMYIHMRDGIYIPHCKGCHLDYTMKRRDLYGSTKFGEEMKLR